MSTFDLGNLDGWENIAVGELVDFPVPEGSFRAVRLDVLADDHVSVRAICADRYWIVGAGMGRLLCRFSMDRDFALCVDGPDGVSVMLRTGRPEDIQVIPESDAQSHTTIEPRRSGPSDELARMMHLVKLNSQRREQMLLDEIKRLGRVQNAKQAPAATPPAASPEAAPAPATGAVEA